MIQIEFLSRLLFAAYMENEKVILLHGLGESPLRMLGLELALLADGYPVINYYYPSRLYTVEELAEKFIAPLVKAHADVKTLHFVTHSLGGVLLRYQMQVDPAPNIGRAVMLAPAHHGSEVLHVYTRNPLFSLMNGPASLQSGVGERCFACSLDEQLSFPAGIIAGCIPSDPLSLPWISWPHDGRTTVKGTMLEGMADHVVVPASHDDITYHPLAIGQTLHFLRHGEFAHSLTSVSGTTAPALLPAPDQRAVAPARG